MAGTQTRRDTDGFRRTAGEEMGHGGGEVAGTTLHDTDGFRRTAGDETGHGGGEVARTVHFPKECWVTLCLS